MSLTDGLIVNPIGSTVEGAGFNFSSAPSEILRLRVSSEDLDRPISFSIADIISQNIDVLTVRYILANDSVLEKVKMPAITSAFCTVASNNCMFSYCEVLHCFLHQNHLLFHLCFFILLHFCCAIYFTCIFSHDYYILMNERTMFMSHSFQCLFASKTFDYIFFISITCIT